MERGKTGTGRGTKNKIAQHPSDLFALGSKGGRNESSDSKRPGVIHGKSVPSSSSSSENFTNTLFLEIIFNNTFLFVIDF